MNHKGRRGLFLSFTVYLALCQGLLPVLAIGEDFISARKNIFDEKFRASMDEEVVRASGQSLGKVSDYQELRRKIPAKYGLLLETLAQDAELGQERLVRVWNSNQPDHAADFIQLLDLVLLNEKFFFEDFKRVINIETMRDVFEKDLVWLGFLLRVIFSYKAVFLELAREDMIGREYLTKAFQDPPGLESALKAISSSPPDTLQGLKDPQSLGIQGLREVFAHDVRNFADTIHIMNTQELAASPRQATPENLQKFFADSWRRAKLVDSSRKLSSYLKNKTLITGVFQGGGAKGIVYGGVLEELERQKIWFNKVAGTSAGSIVSVLIAVGYTSQEIREILFNTDFNQFKDWRWGFVPPWVNIMFTGGLYRGKAFEKWLDEKIEEKLGYVPTFKELSIQLTVIAADLNEKKVLLFNKENTPDLKVSTAVRMSMGIPYFYEVYYWMGPYRNISHPFRVVDGGVSSNFPLIAFVDEANEGEPIIGFMLKEEPGEKSILSRIKTFLFSLISWHPIPKNLFDLLETFLVSRDKLLASHDDWRNTIELPALGVGTTQFNLTDEKKEELIKMGSKATREKLDVILRGYYKRQKTKKPKVSSEMAPEAIREAQDRARRELAGRDFQRGEQVTVEGKTFEVTDVHDDAGLSHRGIALLEDELNYFAIVKDIRTDQKFVLSRIPDEKTAQELAQIRKLPLKRVAAINALGKDNKGRLVMVNDFLSRSFYRYVQENRPYNQKIWITILKNANTVGEDLVLLQEKGRQFGGVHYSDVYVDDKDEWRLVHYGKENHFSDVSGLAAVLYAVASGVFLTRENGVWLYPLETGELVKLGPDSKDYYPEALNLDVPVKVSRLIWRGLMDGITLEHFVSQLRLQFVSLMDLEGLLTELVSIRRYTEGASQTIAMIAHELGSQPALVPGRELPRVEEKLLYVLKQFKEKTLEVYPAMGQKEAKRYFQTIGSIVMTLNKLSKRMKVEDSKKMIRPLLQMYLSVSDAQQPANRLRRTIATALEHQIERLDPRDRDYLVELGERIKAVFEHGNSSLLDPNFADPLLPVCAVLLMKLHDIDPEKNGAIKKALTATLSLKGRNSSKPYIFLEPAKVWEVQGALEHYSEGPAIVEANLEKIAQEWIKGQSLGEQAEIMLKNISEAREAFYCLLPASQVVEMEGRVGKEPLRQQLEFLFTNKQNENTVVILWDVPDVGLEPGERQEWLETRGLGQFAGEKNFIHGSLQKNIEISTNLETQIADAIGTLSSRNVDLRRIGVLKPKTARFKVAVPSLKSESQYPLLLLHYLIEINGSLAQDVLRIFRQDPETGDFFGEFSEEMSSMLGEFLARRLSARAA